MASIRQQIKTLHEKGMIMGDESVVRKILLDENYYNVINAYKDLFLDGTYYQQNINDPDEKYLNNVNFNELFSMFKFDRSLRELFLNYFLIVENQFKTHVAFEFSHKYRNKGKEAYLNYNNYDCGPKNENKANVLDLIGGICETIKLNQKHDIIKHFLDTNQPIPIWALVSFFEMGKIKKFYINCDSHIRYNIAQKYYKIQDSELKSFIETINMFRNVCAHDNRLYCYRIKDFQKQISDMPVHRNMKLTTMATKNGNIFTLGKNDLFACVIALKYLLSDKLFSEFCQTLSNIILKLSSKLKSIQVDKVLKKMGFPLANQSGQLDWHEIINISK